MLVNSEAVFAMFFKIGALKNFASFAEKKTPVLESLFNKVSYLQAWFFRSLILCKKGNFWGETSKFKI